MRRRELLGLTVKLTLSATGGTANAAKNSTATFTVYNNDEVFKEDGLIITSSAEWATASFESGTGVVTVTCTQNPSLNNTRSSIITVSYKGGFS